MSRSLIPFIRSLREAEPYEQEEPGEASFHDLMKRDEIPGLQVGHVELKGPIHKTPGAHDAWHQAYFIYEGAGIVHLGDETRQVEAPALVSIPKHTNHSVEVPDGGVMRYIYINQWH